MTDIDRKIRFARCASIGLLVLGAIACAGDENGATVEMPDAPATTPDAGRRDGAGDAMVTFGATERVLYRISGSDSTAILALDSAAAPRGVAVMPKTYTPIPESEFGVQGDRFKHVVPSPDRNWVAIEPFSTHELLAVVPARGGAPTILDFYFDSGADSLVWAPGGRFLASHYTSPAGFAELRIYDAQRGVRLTTPWASSCTPNTQCAVRSFRWTGPASLTASTTVEGGQGRDYTIDASQLTAQDS